NMDPHSPGARPMVVVENPQIAVTRRDAARGVANEERGLAFVFDEGASDTVVEQLGQRVEPKRVVDEAPIGLAEELGSFVAGGLAPVDPDPAALLVDLDERLDLVPADSRVVAGAVPQVAHVAFKGEA